MNEQTERFDESRAPRCCTCGVPINTLEISRLEGEPCCQRCLAGFAAEVRRSLEPPLSSTLIIPWLRRDELGVPRAFVQTVRDAMSQPTRFFGRIPTASQPWAPLLFAVVCGVVFYVPGRLISQAIILPALVQQSAQVQANEQMANSLGPIFKEMTRQFSDYSPAHWLNVLLQFVIIEILLASWIQQIFVYLAGGRRGFEVTLQVRCYSLVGMSLHLIPVVGLIIGPIYWIAMNALGLREVHGIPGWLSVLAAVSPLLVVLLFSIPVLTTGGVPG